MAKEDEVSNLKLFCGIPTLKKSFLLTLISLTLVSSLVSVSSARQVAKDPDAPTAQEAKVLGWGPVKAPNRAKNPEFMIRGVVLEVNKAPDQKGVQLVKILPIEVLNNNQRVITLEHFQNGYDLVMKVPESKLKELKQGNMVEFNQYYTQKVEQSVGGASMVAFTLNQDIQGYPAGPEAYLKTPGFYPIQYKNALRASKLNMGNIKGDQEVKAYMDYLATKSTDPELKTIALSSYTEFFGGQPTGSCTMQSQKVACR